MSVIVAFVKGNTVYMGADSAGVNAQEHLELRGDPKVFCKGNFLFGVSGSWRANQELRYKTNPVPTVGADIYVWLVTVFLPWLRENVADIENAEILIGIKGKIYHVFGAEQVAKEQTNYAACGSGAQVARGSLYTSTLVTVMTSEEHVTMALRAAERFCSGVRGPFVILENK